MDICWLSVLIRKGSKMKTIKWCMLAFCVMSLSACSVTSEDWEKGESVCEQNGGIKRFSVDGSARCNNGAYFNNL